MIGWMGIQFFIPAVFYKSKRRKVGTYGVLTARYSYGGGRYGMVRTVRYDWYGGTVFPGISDTTGIGMSQVSAYSRVEVGKILVSRIFLFHSSPNRRRGRRRNFNF
eukprot:scaffold3482_cov358-Chaetoceros_neogracile.AAC.3